jgi:hypothetical protein
MKRTLKRKVNSNKKTKKHKEKLVGGKNKHKSVTLQKVNCSPKEKGKIVNRITQLKKTLNVGKFKVIETFK